MLRFSRPFTYGDDANIHKKGMHPMAHPSDIRSGLAGDVSVCLLIRRRFRQDVYAAAFLIELDAAVEQGEQRVVLTLPDIFAGLKLRAELADDDAAGGDRLAAETFDA